MLVYVNKKHVVVNQKAIKATPAQTSTFRWESSWRKHREGLGRDRRRGRRWTKANRQWRWRQILCEPEHPHPPSPRGRRRRGAALRRSRTTEVRPATAPGTVGVGMTHPADFLFFCPLEHAIFHCMANFHFRPCLVLKNFCKIFQTPHHIESLDVCIKY